MKRFLSIILIGSIVFTLAGCALFRDPTKSWEKAVAKQEAASKNVTLNEQKTVSQGRNYVYGVKLALDADPSTNRFHEVANILNSKALEVLGTPNMEEANALRIMVANLISTNQALIAKGNKQLAALDAQVIDLQNENSDLKSSLIRAQKRLLDVGTSNTSFASNWTGMMKIFWYAFYFIIAGFVIKILAAVVPPPYNSIIAIISIPLGLVMKMIKAFVPEATKAAGMVAETTYNNTKLALSHVVESIEEYKKDNPDETTKLATLLKENTSKEVTRPVITEVKKQMGYV